MENREQQILSEIRAMMEAIRSQLELLDVKVAELQQCVDPQEIEDIPIELDIDDDLPFNDMPSSEPEQVELPEPVVVPVQETLEVSVTEEDLPESDVEDDDLPGVFDKVVPLYAAAHAVPKAAPSVAEVMADDQPWRTDMPGSPVKDVRSAISLNDRIIFINYLFGEDPVLFQDTITRINTMTALDQVVETLKAEHQDWDFNSELVYRFMMAVRRRVK
jgi:hypothetical protein